MIVLDQVRHAYDGETVLNIPHFEAAQGERWLLLGPSGSGKTTFLHVVAGLLTPTSGRVLIAGQDVGALKGAALDQFRGRNVGIVFQQMHLLPTLTVEQNLLLAPYMAGLPQDRERVHEVLAGLDLAEKAGAYPEALSYGQKQRVAIARAVMNRPRLILADEPTSSLDDRRGEQVAALLEAQAAAVGATLLVATHDGRLKQRFEKQLLLGIPQAA